jgi:hypothetical protein
MVFFRAIVVAAKFGVIIGLIAVILSTAGIQIFSSAIVSIPGLVLFFVLLMFFFIWINY